MHIHIQSATHIFTQTDFLLAVVTLTLNTDCIDPDIGDEQRNTACK